MSPFYCRLMIAMQKITSNGSHQQAYHPDYW